MEIKIHNKNYELTEHFRQYLLDKFDSLDKYGDDILSFNVNIARDQKHQKGEVYKIEAIVTMPAKQSIIIKETAEDPYMAVDTVQDKMARQLVKQKEKFTSKKRSKRELLKSLKFWHKNQD